MAENLLSTVANARSFTRIFDALAHVQTPALIWHARGGERIELSGRVFMNWVAKSANLLVNECEVTEESGVQITAPPALAFSGSRLRDSLRWQLLRR